MQNFRSQASMLLKTKAALYVRAIVQKAYGWLPCMPKPSWLCIEKQGHFLLMGRKVPNAGTQVWQIADQDSSMAKTLLEYRGDWLAALVDESNCFHQELTLGLSDAAAIEQVLPFQLEHILPFASQEAVWAFSIHSITSTSSRVFVSCVRRQLLIQMHQQMQALGLELDVVVSPAFAVSVAHRNSHSSNKTCLYAWLRLHCLTFFLVDKTGVRGVRDIPIHDPLSLDTLMQEARKTALYLQAPTDHERCLIGQMPQVAQWMESFDTTDCNLSIEDRAKFILQATLDLVSGSSGRNMVFDCSKALGKSKAWFKCRPALRYVQRALAALVASSLLLSYASIARSQRQLELASLHLVEQARSQGIELATLQDRSQPLAWLNQCSEQIDQRLSAYPLSPNLPSVRDTLAWISQLLVELPSARLTSFEYITETHPDPKHPLGRYRTKVDLELEISELDVAQKIQDTFLHAYQWIDKPQSLSWKAQKDRYKVTFYLKDRTPYAP